VPDVRFLLDHLLAQGPVDATASVDRERIGIVGHSFGGWTALAAPVDDRRIKAVVALAPGGGSRPKPGMLRADVTFAWGRDVPTLWLVAEEDVMTPLAGMQDLFARAPGTKQMVILARADHLHFMDDVEKAHEAARTFPWTGDLAWIPSEMRPIGELCSGEQAHVAVRGLAVAHLDAVLRDRKDARRLLAGEVEARLAAQGVAVTAHRA
jgi:dienelactone hydrolase